MINSHVTANSATYHDNTTIKPRHQPSNDTDIRLSTSIPSLLQQTFKQTNSDKRQPFIHKANQPGSQTLASSHPSRRSTPVAASTTTPTLPTRDFCHDCYIFLPLGPISHSVQAPAAPREKEKEREEVRGREREFSSVHP